MTQQSFFQPGQSIVLRQLSYSKIWQVRPVIVVRDTPEIRVLFVHPATIGKDAAERVTPAQRIHQSWVFTDREWGFGGILRLTIPGAGYSVLLLRNADGSLFKWYINLEDPMRRTKLGYDYEDNILDIFVEADLSSWSWKDEDELDEVVGLGIFAKEKAAALYEEGERAVAWLRSGKSPFNAWINWKPDTSWQVPVLPEGWDVL
jgi:hypothetical protein